MSRNPDPAGARVRVLGVQVTCPQCPSAWWMALVPTPFRPRAWHPRVIADVAFSPAEQAAWNRDRDDADLRWLAEWTDESIGLINDQHRALWWHRFHTPTTDVITEQAPEPAGYGRPFEYQPVTRPAGGAS